jgi:PAS domain-containing protein
MGSELSEIEAASQVLAHAKSRPAADASASPAIVAADYAPAPIRRGDHALEDLQGALAALGKRHPEDELNCSGCGYAGCRELAAAILDGAAEPQMCVSNMRRLATRKAAALVKAMPSAVVMVDRSLDIVEANESFVRMFSKAPGPPVRPETLVGTPVADWIEFGGLIRKALRTGQDLFFEHRLYQGKLYNLSVFNVERHRLVGAVVTDMTSLRAARAALAGQVREVLDKSVATVQEIACLLGEHMVQTETLLNAIAADLEEGGEDLEGGS